MTRRASAARVCSPPDRADRRLGPLVAGEPEAAQRGVDALVEGVATEHLEAVLQVGVGGLGHAPVALQRRELGGHHVEVGRPRPDGGAQVRRGHERGIEVGLLGQQPDRQAALALDRAAIRLVAAGGQAQQRRLAGPVRPDEADPVAERDRRLDARRG